MEFSELTLRIILLFLPGLFAFIVIDQLTVHNEYRLHHLLVYSLLLGFFSYSFCSIVIWLFNIVAPSFAVQLTFFRALSDKSQPVEFIEVGAITLVALPVGYAISYCINHKYLFRSAQLLKVTSKFGDIDVWSYILGSSISPYVVIRDLERDLMFKGWIATYSDDSDRREEILLRDVSVYRNSTAEFFYSTPVMYLSRPKEHLVVEFVGMDYTEAIKKKDLPSHD